MRFEQVFDGDLVLDGSVEETLTSAQLTVHQNLNLITDKTK